MRKFILFILLIGLSFLACATTDQSSSVAGTRSGVSREIIFSYNGPQGSRARILQNNQLLGTITSGNTFRRTASNGRHTFETQIEDTSNASNNSQRLSYTVDVRDNAIYLGIVARRMPSGVIALHDFSTVRIVPPVYETVVTDALNVRVGPSANHDIKGRIVRNTRAEILKRYPNSWVKIRYGNGEIGYVNGTFLTPTQPPPRAATIVPPAPTNVSAIAQSSTSIELTGLQFLELPNIKYFATQPLVEIGLILV